MEKNESKTIFRLNISILTKLKVQSLYDVAIPDRAPNNFRGGGIRLVTVYVFDVTQNEILETIFSR